MGIIINVLSIIVIFIQSFNVLLALIKSVHKKSSNVLTGIGMHLKVRLWNLKRLFSC